MNDVAIWKLTADVMLFLSLVFLSFRFGRSGISASQSNRMAQLDNSLRELMRDAEDSSRALSDQLLKRQRDLERLLTDIESIEGRVTKSVKASEERQVTLNDQIQKSLAAANTAQSTAEKAFALSEQIQVQRQALEERMQTTQRALAAERSRAVARPTFADQMPSQPEVQRQSSEIVSEPLDFEEFTPLSEDEIGINARGMEAENVEANAPIIGRAQARAMQAKAMPLANQVEREVSRAAERPTQTLKSSMQRIYQAAENAMQSGRELKPGQVITAQDLEIEDSVSLGSGQSQRPAARDPRLGVLGGIKRQVQIV